MTWLEQRARNLADGRHAAGCFYGGPDGEAFWFVVDECRLDHPDADLSPLVAPAGNVQGAWEHLTLAGLRRTSESG